MSPAGRGAPAALRLLPGLTPWLLLLLLGPHSARGDCGLPPDIPNALPALGGSATFPENSIVTYKCNDGFVKNAGKKDSVICRNSKWSDLEEFCSRSCDVPTRLRFASLQKVYISQNYFPVGSVVDYECRVGYIRKHSLSSKLTCLQNFTWSIPDEFCTRKSCPDPGKIINGQVIIKTDILFGSSITFSCNPGYKLLGTAISYCLRKGTDIGWSAPLPECKESSPTSKVTPTPPKPTTVDVPRTKALTTPLKLTTVDVPGTKASSTSQKPITVNVPATEAPSTPQKSSTVNAPATEAPSTPQKPTTVNIPATETPSTPQKLTTISSSATKALLIPHKPTLNVSATEAPSTPQKLTTISSSATKALLIPHKPTLNVSATEAPSTPQKPTTVNIPATEAPSTPQKLTTINSSATKALLIPYKPTLNVSAMDAPSTPQKPTLNVSAMDAPSTPQKPTTANDSVTIVKIYPVSNALSTETQPTAQAPIMANPSATQATPKTQRFTTAKASFTQSLSVTQKFTPVHAPATKDHHTTQKLTSAHIIATQSQAVPRTTVTSKGSGTLSEGARAITFGVGGATVIISMLILAKIILDCGKSGSYYTHENNKAPNVMFHGLTETGDGASEVRRGKS